MIDASEARGDSRGMLTYYTLLAVSGVPFVVSDPLPTWLDPAQQQLGEAVLGGLYAALCVLAWVARWRRDIHAESTAILGLALVTLGHGAIALLAAQWATGVRLAAAPLMMYSYVRHYRAHSSLARHARALVDRMGRP